MNTLLIFHCCAKLQSEPLFFYVCLKNVAIVFQPFPFNIKPGNNHLIVLLHVSKSINNVPDKKATIIVVPWDSLVIICTVAVLFWEEFNGVFNLLMNQTSALEIWKRRAHEMNRNR